MKLGAFAGGLLFVCMAQGAIQLSTVVPTSVYVVTRAASMEAKALLSARMITLNASSLLWLDGASVVKADVPPSALEALRADRDVVLVLAQDQATAQSQVLPPAPMQAQPPALQQAPPPPMLPSMGPGIGMGMTGGMGMGMGGMAMLDNLAGAMASRIFNRAPACKISMIKTPAKFDAAGGEGTVMVSASGTCAWQAQSSADWIQINSGAGVSGSGLISYTILPGAKKSRSAVIILTAAQGGAPLHGNASHIVLQTGH